MKGEQRAGVSWERGPEQVLLREVRCTDEVIGCWEEEEGYMRAHRRTYREERAWQGCK